ncbi:MAG: oxidoreductase [Cytophagaceae bacterium]|nr:oxidoreductase [Cytophagaceae bacterium]
MKNKPVSTLLAMTFMLMVTISTSAQEKLKVVVAGLSHDHAHVIMNDYKNGKVDIVAIAEENQELVARYAKQYNVPKNIFYPTLKEALANTKPDAVLAYNAIVDHLAVAQVCTPMGIPLMVEKPLAISMDQTREMEALSRKHNTPILTNYETTWYGSLQTLKDKLDENPTALKKMIARDGHEGPKEIGCSKEFLSWLTDPKKNGAGALNDFGCYGANIMTWLHKGKKPIAVTAMTHTLKPNVYPKVDDDAVIILEYEDGTGIIEASWNWSYSLKDFQVYGADASYDAVDGKTLKYYPSHTQPEDVALKETYYTNHVDYLKDYLDGKISGDNDLSSLENNLIVVEILTAAKKSAETGKRIKL